MSDYPSDWKTVRIDEVAVVNPRKPNAEDVNLQVTFLAMEDVSESAKIIGGSERAFSEVSTGYTSFCEDDILVAKITPCFENGKGAHATGLTNGIGFGSTEFHVLRADSCVCGDFLFYLTIGHEFRRRGENNMQGSAGQKRVPTDFVRSYRIPLPPLPEQRKIATILSTWDEAIGTVEGLIAGLEQRKQGLMQRLLTGAVRFEEFVGSEWRTVQLGELFSERKETGFESLPLLSITSGQGIVNRDELDRRDTSNADKSKYLRICPGDIGYNTMRMWQGVSAVSDKEGIVSPAYTICTPQDGIDAQYAGYLFQLPEMIEKFRRYSQGLVKDTLNLKFNDFAQIEARIPLSLREQRRITTVLNLQEQSIRGLQEYCTELGVQKKGLMQRLLTGEVRVAV